MSGDHTGTPAAGRPWKLSCVIIAFGLILTVVVSLFLPKVRGARWSAWRSVTQNNLKEIGAGLHAYHDEHGVLPHLPSDILDPSSSESAPIQSWLVGLLPHLGRADLSRRYDRTLAYTDPMNLAVVGVVVDGFLCPDSECRDRTTEGGFGLAHLAGNVHLLGKDGPPTLGAVTDGVGNTLLAGQLGSFPRPWADPSNLRSPSAGIGTSPRQFGGSIGGGTMVFCDGTTSFVSESIDPAVLAALGTPDGGEDVSGGF